jgi:hypothetical protein
MYAVFPGVVRAEHRCNLCQHAGGQGVCGARSPDAAGSSGQGIPAGRHLKYGRGERADAELIESYNRKFAKVPRNTHDAHRALRPEEDLELILTWRELRKVTQNLLLHYERKLYVLLDTPDNRR